MEIFDFIPLWFLFILVLAISFAFLEGGTRLGTYRRKKFPNEPDAPLGSMVASTLGLLAFMLAFTFNIAATRFDERRLAVLDEANSIGTTYLRASLFDEPMQGEIKKLLREYVQLRAKGINALKLGKDSMVRSEALQQELWARATTIARNTPTPVAALFVSSLNETIDLHSKRLALAFYTRVPETVWMCLFVVSALSFAGLGYYCGCVGTSSRAESGILIATFSLVILLVADLERPHQGLIRVNQQPMLDLAEKLGPP